MTTFHEFVPGLGCIIHDIPEQILNLAWKAVLKAEKDGIAYNRNLVGQLERQFQIAVDKDFLPLQLYLNLLANQYDREIGGDGGEKNFDLAAMWVNYQKKHEFQPSHTHDGDFSFVMWMKVPYSMEKEAATSFSSGSKESLAGCFEFCYPIPGTLRTKTIIVHADRSYEGRIALFPSHLQHAVYPFSTSEEYRISVSGNLNGFTIQA